MADATLDRLVADWQAALAEERVAFAALQPYKAKIAVIEYNFPVLDVDPDDMGEYTQQRIAEAIRSNRTPSQQDMQEIKQRAQRYRDEQATRAEYDRLQAIWSGKEQAVKEARGKFYAYIASTEGAS